MAAACIIHYASILWAHYTPPRFSIQFLLPFSLHFRLSSPFYLHHCSQRMKVLQRKLKPWFWSCFSFPPAFSRPFPSSFLNYTSFDNQKHKPRKRSIHIRGKSLEKSKRGSLNAVTYTVGTPLVLPQLTPLEAGGQQYQHRHHLPGAHQMLALSYRQALQEDTEQAWS